MSKLGFNKMNCLSRMSKLEIEPYKFDYRKISKVVECIAFYLRGYDFMDILHVLDSLSQRNDIDCVMDGVKWNWGQCIMAILAQSRKLVVFDLNYHCISRSLNCIFKSKGNGYTMQRVELLRILVFI